MNYFLGWARCEAPNFRSQRPFGLALAGARLRLDGSPGCSVYCS